MIGRYSTYAYNTIASKLEPSEANILEAMSKIDLCVRGRGQVGLIIHWFEGLINPSLPTIRSWTLGPNRVEMGSWAF